MKHDPIIFFLLSENRPKIGVEVIGHFWHCGAIYLATTYECLDHGRTIEKDVLERLIDSSFKDVVFFTFEEINVPRLLSNLDSGTNAATFISRILNFSNSDGIEKDDITIDDVFTKIKEMGGKEEIGVPALRKVLKGKIK
jgi:hypothetical protein